MRRFLLTFVIFTALILKETVVKSQSEAVLPVRFSQFTANYQLLNPALMNMELNRFIKVGSQITGGGFERVYSLYATGVVPVFKQSNTTQRLGLSFLGDWEGRLISRSWAMIDYGVEINIAEKWKLGAGARAGLLSYVVRNTDVSAGGSATAPDLSIGLKLRRRNSHIAIAYNQINQGELIPIDQSLQLVRNINITSQIEFQLSRMLVFTPAMWLRVIDDIDTEYSVSADFTFNNLISFQSLWFYERNLTFAVGLKNIRVSNALLSFQFSYTVGVGRNRFDQFELYEGHFGLGNWNNE